MRTNIQCRIAAWVVVVAWFILAPTVRADQDYYMLIFAYEGEPNIPRAAHTFATFVKVSYKPGTDPKLGRVERHTISWLPATLNVRLLRTPEPGKNLGLEASLKLGMSEGAALMAWGPYRIQKMLYDRALVQIQRLDQGKVEYKALDRAYRPEVATNCIHAVSDIVAEPLLNTGTAYGNEASAMVVEYLSGWIINPNETHAWLIDRLGLDKNTIVFEP